MDERALPYRLAEEVIIDPADEDRCFPRDRAGLRHGPDSNRPGLLRVAPILPPDAHGQPRPLRKKLMVFL